MISRQEPDAVPPRGAEISPRRRKSSAEAKNLTADLVVPLLFVLVLTGFSLVAFFPDFLSLDTQAVSVPFRAAVLLVSFFALVKGVGKIDYKGIGVKAFLLFWFIYLCRLLSDTYLFPVSLVRPPETYVLFGLGVSLIPALALFVAPSAKGLRRAEAWLCGSLIVALIVTLLRGDASIIEHGRLTGNTTDNPITIGHLGASLCILSAGSFLGAQRRGRFRAAVNLGSFLLGLATLIFAGSRGPILGALIPLAIFFTMSKARASKPKVIVVVLLSLLVIPVFLNKASEIGANVLARVFFVHDAESVQKDVRTGLVQAAWAQFLESPTFGTALEVRGMGYPHDIVVEALMATGVVGGAALFGLIAVGVASAFKLLRASSPAQWMGLLFLQYLIGALFSGTLYDNSQFWCFYAGLIAVSKRFPSPPTPP